jgi:integrase
MPRMRIVNHDLKQRGNTWWLKKRVPSDVIESFGKSVVEESLRTRDGVEARRRRDARLRELEASWQQLRQGGASSELEALYEECLRNRAKSPALSTEMEPVVASDLLWEELDRRSIRWGVGMGYLEPDSAPGDMAIVRDRYVAQTDEGRALSARLRASRGNVPIEVAGEKWLAIANVTEGTKSEYRRFLRRAGEALPSIDQITADVAREFIQQQATNLSRKSITNQRSALCGLWSHLGKDPSIWKNFRVDVGVEKVDRDIWRDDDLKRLFTNTDSIPLRRAMFIALHTGARAKEIGGIQYDNARDLIVIKRAHSKTDAGERLLPCPDVLRPALIAWVQKPMRPQSISNRFSEYKKSLGFGGEQVFHSFRHTLASRLHSDGIQEATASLIVGHKPSHITYRTYGNKVDAEVFRPILNNLNWQDIVGPVE